MKRLICAALGLLMLLCACSAAMEAPALLEPITIGSDLAAAEIGDLYDGMVLEGSILPEMEKLSFSAGGTINEIRVVLGSKVKKDDVLVRLDTTALQSRRDTLADQLENARTLDGFDTREAELNAKLLAAQYGEDSARYQLYISEQEQAAQTRAASIAALEEQLAAAEEDLNFQSVITAPFDGTVVDISAAVGERVSANASVIVVANDSTCFLQTDYITEPVVRAATALYATVGGVHYEVEYIPPDAEAIITQSLTGNVMNTTFQLENADSDLIGQYALLYLMTEQREAVLNIPSNAVLKDAGGYYVYVDRDGVKTRQQVEIGMMTAAQAEILSGLQEGENVYVVG